MLYKGVTFQFLDGSWRFLFGTIERIWSRNWWKNPSAEIERIDQKVKDIMKSEKIREQILVLEQRNIKKQLLVKEVRHYIQRSESLVYNALYSYLLKIIDLMK